MDTSNLVVPPPECKKDGGYAFRVLCTDDGYPIPFHPNITNTDEKRARTKIPGHDFKGDDFGSMSKVLNGWLNNTKSIAKVKACDQWTVEELQKFRSLVYLLREAEFDEIYHQSGDNRRIRHESLKVRVDETDNHEPKTFTALFLGY